MIGMHPMFRKWLLIFLGLALSAAAVIALAIGALMGYLASRPPLDVLENYNPPEISRVYDRTGNKQIAEFFDERRELVRYKDVPEHMINAFIAIEDERFHNHFGIDFEAWGRVFKMLASGGRVQGASTITMQVARNVVLEDTKRNATRKLKEMLVALQIERDYTKEQILEFYMNHIFFGNRAYGIQAAAKAYFNKDVKDLTTPEAALLAGLPKAPSELSPTRSKERAKERRDTVLFNMLKNGFIKTREEYERYRDTPIVLNPAPRPKMDAEYFADYVGKVLMKDNSMEKTNELGQKGYQVISTVDLPLQTILEEELSKGLRVIEKEIEVQKPSRAAKQSGPTKGQAYLARIEAVKENSMTVRVGGARVDIKLPEKLPYFDPAKIVRPGNLIDVVVADYDKKTGKPICYLYDKTTVQGAAVLFDVRSGEMLALAGGDDYNDMFNNGQYNRGVQGGRQPGSCWKPLLYGASFDVVDSNGAPRFSPGTVMIDEPFSIGNWAPKNYEGKFYGATTLYESLVKSRNIPTVKLFMEIGRNEAVKLYRKFNVVNGYDGWKLTNDPPMSLGTPNVTPLELAAAYGVFANQGLGVNPTPIKRMFSAKSPGDSKIVKPEFVRVLTPEAAYMTARILQDVFAKGTAKNTVGKWMDEAKKKGLKVPEMGGKTGTTNDCYVAWLVGFSPDVVLAVYIGYDQHRSMGTKIVGGKDVGPMWSAMMERILKTRNDWKMKFDVPAGLELRDICSKSGMLATGSCAASGNMVFNNSGFKKGFAPARTCTYHGGSYSGGSDAGTEQEDGDSAYVPAPAAGPAYEPMW